MVVKFVSKSPLVAVARYGAIGSSWFQRQVVRVPTDLELFSTPLASATLPRGTVTRKSNVALSRGLSLAGYQPGEPCGSLTTKAPSSVGIQPSIELSGSTTTSGTPSYFTSTSNSCPAASGDAGVMISSCPSRAKVAGASSTLSAPIAKPRKSRLKRLSASVAVARTVAWPPSTSVAGS